MNSLVLHKTDAVISIVLGSYNRLPFLKKSISSIRQNNIDVPYEIIVVDGGSRDGTLNWLKRQKDIITIIQHNHGKIGPLIIQRRSWGYFMNLAIRSTQGKYVVMISDDCLLVKNSIMNGFHLFEEKLCKGEKIGALAFYWRNWPTQDFYMIGKAFGGNLFVNHGMYLRSAFEEVGMFEEKELTFYYADTDLSLKMLQAGYKTEACPSAFVEHFEHASLRMKRKNLIIASIELNTYLDKWSSIYPDAKVGFRGGRQALYWTDPNKTYKNFPVIAIIKFYFVKYFEKIKPYLKKIMHYLGLYQPH